MRRLTVAAALLLATAVPIQSLAISGQALPRTGTSPSLGAGPDTASAVVRATASPVPAALAPAAPAPAAPNPLWTALISALAALGGAIVGYFSTRASSRAALIQKTNELEIDAIDRRLSEFVGPFIQLSEENRLLALELKRRQGGDFRTLVALLTPGWREGLFMGEANLLDAVVANGVELRELLTSKGAAMVSPALVPYFSRASTHFRFLDLAHRGSLDPDPDRYAAYVYPRELDAIMEAERTRLEERRELLRREPHRTHARMPDLQPPLARGAAAPSVTPAGA